jgi:hypothetical protein
MADVEPISTTFLSRLVMVSCEMHSRLSSRIYKNGVQTSASGAVSPNSQWSIPMVRAEFLPFALKIVEHSRHLPAFSRYLGERVAEYDARGEVENGRRATHDATPSYARKLIL